MYKKRFFAALSVDSLWSLSIKQEFLWQWISKNIRFPNFDPYKTLYYLTIINNSLDAMGLYKVYVVKIFTGNSF